MKRLVACCALLAAVCSACCFPARDCSLYQTSGMTKPIVAVLPIINHVENQPDISWDVSRELTEEMRKKIFTSSKLYLLREGGSAALAAALAVPNPSELAEVDTHSLGAAEFVVVAEIIDLDENFLGVKNPNSLRPPLDDVEGTLSLAMRLRVLDVRESQPKIILQEVISHEHFVTAENVGCDYSKTAWGTEGYERTPLGVSHSRLVRELVSRIEGYVGANKG